MSSRILNDDNRPFAILDERFVVAAEEATEPLFDQGSEDALGRALADLDLSLRAKGLLAMMLAFPTMNLMELESFSTDGRSATRKAAAQLRYAGYIKRTMERGPDGKSRGTRYRVVGVDQ